MVKKCKVCGEEKPATTEYFYRDKGGLRSCCIPCLNAIRREKRKQNAECEREKQREYYRKNKVRILERQKKYAMLHREEKRKYLKQWLEKNKERKREKDKQWYLKNREEQIIKRRQYYLKNREKLARAKRLYEINVARKDPNWKIARRLRQRVRSAIKHGYKSASTMELLGCTIEELRIHLEKQFTDGMTWDAFMRGEIHIDHIRPCATFDLTDPEQQKQCFHYTNLQPLWAKDNIRKKANWSGYLAAHCFSKEVE